MCISRNPAHLKGADLSVTPSVANIEGKLVVTWHHVLFVMPVFYIHYSNISISDSQFLQQGWEAGMGHGSVFLFFAFFLLYKGMGFDAGLSS